MNRKFVEERGARPTYNASLWQEILVSSTGLAYRSSCVVVSRRLTSQRLSDFYTDFYSAIRALRFEGSYDYPATGLVQDEGLEPTTSSL